MSIIVKDILSLQTTKNFTLIAGQSGLGRIIETVDILDYAWEQDRQFSRKLFKPKSFPLSSLQFAKGNPEYLLAVISHLIECGVSGIAYKPVYYYDLPARILDLANSCNFPIFRIEDGDTLTYREIICGISDVIRADRIVSDKSDYVKRMASGTLKAEEVPIYAGMISPRMKKNACVVNITLNSLNSSVLIDHLVCTLQGYQHFMDSIVLCRLDTNLVLIISDDSENPRKFNSILDQILQLCDVDRETIYLARSGIHPTYSSLDKCIQESCSARLAGLAMDWKDTYFSRIGPLAFLIPLACNASIQEYMENFLFPIIDNEESMRTVIAFVRADGNFKYAAQMLNCHQNTLRYRIGKIQSLLAPEETWDTFFQNLSIAIKIYLVRKLQN